MSHEALDESSLKEKSFGEKYTKMKGFAYKKRKMVSIPKEFSF